MQISKQWLQDFVDISKVSPQEIAKRLSLSTVEVEGVNAIGDGLEGVVVGLVKTVEKHPNADKLNVCMVDVGKKMLKIVCGGSNVRVGMKVALAQIGAKVKWHGEGDLIELTPAEIRGVPSEGMICGADEIGLIDMFPKKEEKEIVDLSAVALAKVGLPLSQALGLDDVVFEIDNKSLSNRPDLWGHYGIAREVAALFQKTLKPYQTKNIKAREHKNMKALSLAVDVEDKKLCPRYMAVAIDGIDVGPSPDWMQARLRSAGVRPINNIVDSTNYVMMEVGQPMHAFDAEKLRKNMKASKPVNSIVVRRAKDGERLKALDGKDYTLAKDMLVIADHEKPLAIAGVMGGEDSSVTSDTKTIIFESANFDPVSIRKTSVALGLRSESSARFEKGLSAEQTEVALKKAVELTLLLCPRARVASVVVDKKAPAVKRAALSIPREAFVQKLGMDIGASEIQKILERLGFKVGKTKTAFSITVPYWRTKDVNIAEDVIEEVARMHGYEKIPATLPQFPIAPPSANTLRTFEHRVRELLAFEHGFSEVYNYSFVSGETIERCGLSVAEHLELANPIAKDRPYIRRTLKLGLIENMESNLHRAEAVALFEIGRTYLRESLRDDLPEQPTMLGLAYAMKKDAAPFATVAGALRKVFARLGGVVEFEQSSAVGPIYHPGRSAYVVVSGQKVGSIGELHPAVAKRMGIDARVAIAEIALSRVVPLLKESASYRAIPAFPAVTRDIAFVVDRATAHAKIAATIRALHPLIHEVELFDVFSGGAIPANKKSMAYHVVYEDPTKTLDAVTVDAIHDTVRKKLVEQFGAEIR